jgi:2,4-dienoyl-CoA reductase (NADPH2)
MPRFTKLFEPIKVGQVELKNRLICLAMGTGIRIHDAEFSHELIGFYETRVSGGAAAAFVPMVPIYSGATFNIIFPGAYEDRLIPSMREMAKAIHAHNAKAGAQLFIMDDQYARGKGAPAEIVGPSAVAKPRGKPCRELSIEEIEYIVDGYAEAARRARDAGFDMVEFHFGIGYLVSKFISPLTNKRIDQYGGALQKRMKLPLDILAAVRKKAGTDYTLSVRFAADELMEGGLSSEDGKEVAKSFEKAGVSLLDVQCGWHESPIPMIQMSVPRGRWVYLAEGIKKVTNTPVVAAYRINDPVLAEEIVSSGKADLIGMARAFLADPELPKKAKEGRIEDIRICTACCYCLDQVHADMVDIMKNAPVACAINAQTGKETKRLIKPAAEPKKVTIIGGGPAGMEAARVAALRGHKVTLYEKENKLGGLLNVAILPPYKEELVHLINYLSHQVQKNGVLIKLGEEFTEDALERDMSEVVVVATGRTVPQPDIPGADKGNVVSVIDVLTCAREVGDRVLIVGGGRSGCETADFLNLQGKQVTILEKGHRVGIELGPTSRWTYILRFISAGVRMERAAEVTRITEKGVEVSRNGATEFFAGDTVVLATGTKPNNKLYSQLKGTFAGRLEKIGDCVEPHGIAEAIETGFLVATSL